MRRWIGASVAMASALMLSACGSSYEPLGQSNFGSTLGKAMADATSVHVVTTQVDSKTSSDVVLTFGATPAMQMTLTSTVGDKSTTFIVRLVGSMMYTQVPGLMADGMWDAIDTDKLPITSTEPYQKVSAGDFANLVNKGVTSVKYVGETTVLGAKVRQYTVQVKASSLSSSLVALLKTTTTSTDANITEQVYVDENNRLHRISLDLPKPVGLTTMDFSQWNDIAPIQAPSASQIQSVGE